MKPYFKSGGITISHADCRKMASVLRGGVDLLLTDPPYGIGFDTDYKRFPNGGKTYPPVHGDAKPFDPAPWLTYPQGDPFRRAVLRQSATGRSHYCLGQALEKR